MMIGVVVSAVLHGVCLLQAFYYFQSVSLILVQIPCILIMRNLVLTEYKKDGILLKGLVSVTVHRVWFFFFLLSSECYSLPFFDNTRFTLFLL